MKGYDEPEILRSQLSQFGPISADAGHDTLHLRNIVGQDSGALVPAKDIPIFFTMLSDMASYRKIVVHLGPDEARLALRSINDMVEADDRPVGKPWLRAARETQIFLNAFLR